MIPGAVMPSRMHSIALPSRSRGVVLAVVLVVLVVMMLGGISLLRSIDTSTILSGNLAFRRDSVNHSTVGLNAALAAMQNADFKDQVTAECVPTAASCGGAAAKWLAMNYWPRLLEADGNGVPVIIKDTTTFDAKFGIQPTAAAGTLEGGNKIRFLIERMCSDYGPSDETKCSVSDNYELGGSYRQDKPGSISLPLYRVTIRSDGPRNTLTYTQAIITTRIK